MSIELLSQFTINDMLIQYWIDPSSRQIGLLLLPAHLAADVDQVKDYGLDPLIQIKLAGDDYPGGFAQGRTMRNAQSVKKFKYDNQYIIEEEPNRHIVTVLKDEHNLVLEHKLSHSSEFEAFEVNTTIVNEGTEDRQLEMLSSFSFGGITPFEQGDTPGILQVHRLRSKWSSEGRLETRSVEELQLEPSWSGYGVHSERFGQVGSMPVRGFFPFVAVEDTKKKVVWAAQLAYAGSWQLELYRQDDALAVSGGLADREFGQWLKILKPNEKLVSPSAYLTVVAGDFDQATKRLTSIQAQFLNDLPETENELPIIFNEHFATMGVPSHANLSLLSRKLKGKGFTYLVIDAGWYAESGNGWQYNIGDWRVWPALFPQGLEAALQEIRNNGMIPGIWFELESCTPLAEAYTWTEHLLQRDGVVIQSGQRRFWNFTDHFVIDYLTEKVIAFLRKYNFGYLKIDYNETIGIGCDGFESPGEGLRRHLEGVQAFIRKIRQELPDLVIENCSSGGHRLEPSMIGLTSLTSFSDAHEELEIPIIAANLHRAMLPRQLQIWAVLRKGDSRNRLIYSLASTFLGRMCLTGEIYDLDEEQWQIVDEGIAFYKRLTELIKAGSSYRYGPPVNSYRHPEGWQIMLRVRADRQEALVVFHLFGGQLPEQVDVQVSDLGEEYEIAAVYAEDSEAIRLQEGYLTCRAKGHFQAAAVLLKAI